MVEVRKVFCSSSSSSSSSSSIEGEGERVVGEWLRSDSVSF